VVLAAQDLHIESLLVDFSGTDEHDLVRLAEDQEEPELGSSANGLTPADSAAIRKAVRAACGTEPADLVSLLCPL